MMLISLFSINLIAIPANPKPITIKQANGKTLTLTLKGDEKVNWATTIDQYTLVRNSENVFVYAQLNERGDLVPSNFIASNSDERTSEERLFLSTLPYNLHFSNRQIQERKALYQTENTHKAVTTGQVRLLLILVGFSDKPFTYTQSDFNNMCNQVGYNVNGATGSVRDYYYDNSGNALEMIIDVFKAKYDKLVEKNDDSILTKEKISECLLEYNIKSYTKSSLFKTKEEVINYLIKHSNFPKLDNERQRYIIEKYGENEDAGRCADEIIIYVYERKPISLIEYIGKEKGFEPKKVNELHHKYIYILESINEINQIFNIDNAEI
jgi:hypothetical protein